MQSRLFYGRKSTKKYCLASITRSARLAFRCLSSIPSAVDKVVAHLSPIIEERKFNRQEHGSKYDGAPVRVFPCWPKLLQVLNCLERLSLLADG